jgi:hypothetical protein
MFLNDVETFHGHLELWYYGFETQYTNVYPSVSLWMKVLHWVSCALERNCFKCIEQCSTKCVPPIPRDPLTNPQRIRGCISVMANSKFTYI